MLNLVFIRNLCSKCKLAKEKAKRIKYLNSETKALYGAVQKKSKKKLNIVSEKKPETEKSSEVYWLLEHQSDIKAKAILKQKKLQKIKIESLDTTFKCLINSSTFPLLGQTRNDTIPFNNKELKEILNYPIVSKGNKNIMDLSITNEHIPSVTKILQNTLSESARTALLNWKLSKIAELGDQGFKYFQKELLRKGKLFHESIQEYFNKGIEPEKNSEIFHAWKSVTYALDRLNLNISITEGPIKHPYLKYCGVFDSISTKGSDVSVIEWKKSDKLKDNIFSTYDAPIQLAAYIGALSADERYNMIPKSGHIVIAYSNGNPAQIFSLNDIEIKNYWRKWLERLQEYWIRTRDNTLPEPI